MNGWPLYLVLLKSAQRRVSHVWPKLLDIGTTDVYAKFLRIRKSRLQ